MAIRAEERKYYDARWRKFRLAAIEAAGGLCQRCGCSHSMLNLAHLSHDAADRTSLMVLCPSCHSKNDTSQRVAMTRRTRAQRRGQLWICEEVRLAPYPPRMWPFHFRQLDLFGPQR